MGTTSMRPAISLQQLQLVDGDLLEAVGRVGHGCRELGGAGKSRVTPMRQGWRSARWSQWICPTDSLGV